MVIVDGDLHLPLYRRDGEIGAVSVACLAPRFDGRANPDLGVDPCGDDGDGRDLHGGTHVAAI